MNHALAARLRAAGMSAWELADLTGVHPHTIPSGRWAGGGDLLDCTARTVTEIARRLDMHPADLIPELEPLLRNSREENPAGGTPAGQHGQAPATTSPRILLAALAAASCPLDTMQLAEALGWHLEHVSAALQHLHNHPELAGPMALRRVPPDAWTLEPRLGILSPGQLEAIRRQGPRSDPPDAGTHIIQQALAHGGTISETATNPANWQFAQTVLTAGRLLTADDQHPGRLRVTDDVLFSLRYLDELPAGS